MKETLLCHCVFPKMLWGCRLQSPLSRFPVCYQLMHSFSWGSGSQGEPEAIRKRLAENQTEKASVLGINLLTELLWSRKEEKEDSRQGENWRGKNRKDRKIHSRYRLIFLLQWSQRISALNIYRAWNRISLFLFSQGGCKVSLIFVPPTPAHLPGGAPGL